MPQLTKLTEIVIPAKCDYIAKLTYDAFFEHFPSRKTPEKGCDKLTGKGYFKMVKNLVRKFRDNNYRLEVTYKHNCRQYAIGESIQKLSGALRRFLTGGVMRDIDIKNCHPVLLRIYAKENKLAYATLDTYCDEREKFFQRNGVGKKDIFKFLFNDNPRTNKHSSEIKAFVNECKAIKNHIYENHKDTIDYDNDKSNYISSVASKYLQLRENEILMNAIEKVDKSKVTVLMYDGFMTTEDFDVSILNTKDITWDEKDNTSCVDMEDVGSTQTYESLKIDWESENSYYAHKILDPVSYAVKIGAKWVFYKKTELTDAFSHLSYVDDNGVDKPFLDKWFKDQTATTKFGYINTPYEAKPDERYFNMWNPYDVTQWDKTDYEYDEEASKAFFNHIKVLTNYEEEVYQFVVRWIAHIFQKPHKKPNMCLITTGEEGTGKDTIIQFIYKMMGKGKYIEITDPEQNLFGNFNGDTRDAKLIHISEVSKKDTAQHIDKLKGYITQSEVSINEKNKARFTIENLRCFWILSNHNDVVNLTKGARRWVHFITSNDKVGDTEYFTNLYSHMESRNSLMSIYEDLMKVKNIPDQFDAKDIVYSSYHKSMIMDNDPYEIMFLKYFVRKCVSEGMDTKYSSAEMYSFFKSYMVDNFGNCQIGIIPFGRRITALMTNYSIVKKIVRGTTHYVMNTDDLYNQLKIEEPYEVDDVECGVDDDDVL